MKRFLKGCRWLCLAGVVLGLSACVTPTGVKSDGKTAAVKTVKPLANKKPRPVIQVPVLQTEEDFLQQLSQAHREALNLALGATGKIGHPALNAMLTNTLKGGAAELAQLRSWRQRWYPEQTIADFLPAPVEFQGARTQVEQDLIERLLAQHERSLAFLEQAQDVKLRPELQQLVETIRQRQQQESERLLAWSEDGLPAYTPSTRRISRPATTPRNQTKATQQKAKKTTAKSNQKRRR